jgi:hypothetical protein
MFTQLVLDILGLYQDYLGRLQVEAGRRTLSEGTHAMSGKTCSILRRKNTYSKAIMLPYQCRLEDIFQNIFWNDSIGLKAPTGFPTMCNGPKNGCFAHNGVECGAIKPKQQQRLSMAGSLVVSRTDSWIQNENKVLPRQLFFVFLPSTVVSWSLSG